MSLTNARDLITNSRSNLSLNVLKYPNDIDSVPHKIIFRFIKRNTSVSDRQFRITSQNSKDYLVLPVPTNIQDGVGIDYKVDNLGLIGELGSNVLRGLARDGLTSQTSYENAFQTVIDGVRSSVLSGALAQATAASAAAGLASRFRLNLNPDRINNVISAGLGRIVNPFTTAIFQGVKLRTFSFEWNLSPSSRNESEKIEQIIKMLRTKALPKVKTTNGNAFMEFPEEVEFTFLGMQNDTFSFPTAPCVVTSFNVDRTPTGNPVFFAGTGAPAFFNISINLLEVRPLVVQDVANGGQTTEQVTINPTLVVPTRQ